MLALALLVLAGALVVTGCALLSVPLAFIVAGALLGVGALFMESGGDG